MHSCIYEGVISHLRRRPVSHRFQYRAFMVYLDLDEIRALTQANTTISSKRFSGQSFLRKDHLFDPSLPLEAEVRDRIESETGNRPTGPIRLLTQLRCYGTYFSPLNLFYVFDQQGEQVEYVLAEVNNTPWLQRHCYVLWQGNATGRDGQLEFAHPKEFHVSPFMDMQMQYHWQLAEPNETLSVKLSNLQGSDELFTANMQLQRSELTRQNLRRLTIRYPLMAARITAAIYYQALKLWWKKCPFYPHPHKQSNPLSPAPTS